MARRGRGAAAACALLLAFACSSGSGTDDPVGQAPGPPAGAGPPAATAASVYGAPTVLGTVSDPAIAESSGLAASRRFPGLVWTHNDSGDDPLLFCLDMKGATNCGVWRVTGAEAFDWEDMAAGPGPDGSGPSLYLGDIGDNIDQRTDIVVYRIPEPTAAAGPPSTAAAPATTAPAAVLRLRYPNGPHNAEALAVHPTTGDVYVISKDAQSARVYKAKAPVAGTTTNLAQVGTIRLGTGARGLEVITGADISPDGTRVALSSYAQGYELVLPAGGVFDDIWGQHPVPVALGSRLQGEAVAYRVDGRALLTSSEISPWALQQVERR